MSKEPFNVDAFMDDDEVSTVEKPETGNPNPDPKNEDDLKPGNKENEEDQEDTDDFKIDDINWDDNDGGNPEPKPDNKSTDGKPKNDDGTVNWNQVAKDLGLEGEFKSAADVQKAMSQTSATPVDEEINTNESRLKRVDNIMKLSRREKIKMEFEQRYSDDPEITQDDIEDLVEETMADKIKAADTERQINQSLENYKNKLISRNQELKTEFQEKRQMNSKNLKESLYNSRQYFGDSQLSQDVLKQAYQNVANGGIEELLKDPAKAAELSLLWEARELIKNRFQQPDNSEVANDIKKKLFLSTTNSKLQKGTNHKFKPKAEKGGFDADKFMADDEDE
jgi:hypothetical protein